MSLWVFVLILHLTSFGGKVTTTVEAQTYEGCVKLRHLVIDKLGGDVANINGSISARTVVVPPRRPQDDP